MRKQDHITIETIIFEEGDCTAHVNGTVTRDSLRYSSNFVISHTQLNRITAELHKQNDSFNIYDHLMKYPGVDGNGIYHIDLSNALVAQLPLALFITEELYAEIRA